MKRLVFMTLCLAACGGDDDGAAADATPITADAGPSDAAPEPALVQMGIDQCLQALAGNVSVRPTALATLKQATMEFPSSGRAFIYLGMCSLSALAEDNDFSVFGDVEPALTRAAELRPDDARIPGWLGTVKVATARALGSGLDEACQYMIEAAALDPEFNNVSLAIAFAPLPLDSGYPQMAVDALDAISACADTNPICQDTPIAPHNTPGSLRLYGDVHARVGDEAAARMYYQAALDSPSADTWAFKQDCQDDLDNLAARIAAWADADPSNDPQISALGPTACRGCHQ